MKTILKYTAILFILAVFVQCEKYDEVGTPDLKVTMITAPEDVVTRARIQFQVSTKAEFLTFYNGLTAEWANYPEDRGVAVTLPANRSDVTVILSYAAAGTYKLIWVATNYGDYTKDMVQEFVEFDMVVNEPPE